MGTYQSIFEKTPEQSEIDLNTTKSDWITGHADMTGLAVVEVQRYWNRFQMLGCDKNGFLSSTAIDKSELVNDVFVKNIVSNLPRDKKGRLSFMVFLNFIIWLEKADNETKLKIIFNFLNNGNDLDSNVLNKLLKRIYLNSKEDELKATLDLLMLQLDPKKTGRITEAQFIKNIQKEYTDYELNEFLNIELIPNDILDETNMHPSTNASKMNMRNDPEIELKSEITDKNLETIARLAVKKEWEKLSIKLGFLESDIKICKKKNKGDKYETMLELLKEWRDQDPLLATKARLKRYLVDTEMKDAAASL